MVITTARRWVLGPAETKPRRERWETSHVRDPRLIELFLILAIVLRFGTEDYRNLEKVGKAIQGFKRTMRHDDSSLSELDTPSDNPRHPDVKPADA